MLKQRINSAFKSLATLVVGGLLLAHSSQAMVKVFACEPEWAALVQTLAGDAARVYTATTAFQDPHHVEARPSLMAAVRNADLIVCNGAELEVGWLPLLLRQSGNARVQPGQPGYFEASAYVKLLQVPTRLDRADGDVHAAGNPHINTSPGTFAAVALQLTQRLVALDPAQAGHYQQRLAEFQQQWRQATARWALAAEPLKGVRVVVQHDGFPYLVKWLGLVQVAVLEPKPGVEPSSTHLASVLRGLQQQPAQLLIRAAYNDDRGTQWLADRTKLPVAVLPWTVGGSERAKDLFGLFDDTLAQLLKALPAGRAP
jgi:zinc/manganese transport system substrate-binding protein